MLDFTRRCYQKELLDNPSVPFDDIRLNMQELEFINTRLGGHAITISGVLKLMGNRNKIHICEIGCGGGDNLKAIDTWCLKHGVDAKFTGIDIKDTCIRWAEENTRSVRHIRFICSDYRFAALPEKPDIIFSSLFCHHFNDEELKEIIAWKYQHSSLGFFINDLHRHPLAYHSIRILSRLFSSSYLVKHDAPLSVRRGFSRSDWKKALEGTGIWATGYKESGTLTNEIHESGNIAKGLQAVITWKWAFRWLIIVRK